MLNKVIKEWISLLALGIAHYKAINIGNRNMDACLEGNNDFHRIYFHLV